MPEGQGAFDGGGSVRWEVKNLKDDGNKFSSGPDVEPASRKTKGVDKADGDFFQIVLKVPNDGSRTTFLAQFTEGPNDDDEIVLKLNREDRKDQIRVVWPESSAAQSS